MYIYKKFLPNYECVQNEYLIKLFQINKGEWYVTGCLLAS